mmetsp:Transcript_26416/g.83928  ORF Transcript_26416/g.83928 Transcript_26416/m.83928 type:complete len:136 (+) Transcript_26416:480-887(+)
MLHADHVGRSSEGLDATWLGGEFEHAVLTVKPGPGSYFQDVALYHRPSKTLLLCDAMLSVTEEPPPILTSDPEYVRALLFHARDARCQPRICKPVVLAVCTHASLVALPGETTQHETASTLCLVPRAEAHAPGAR